MSGEELAREPHEGERYLALLGFNLEDFAEREIVTAKGTIQARDFLDICGDHARPLLVGLESMGADDPRYEGTRNILRDVIAGYIGRDPGQAN